MAEAATILAVEDDDDLRRLVGDVLTQAGFRVLAAASGEAALSFLESEEPIHLLFTDIVMPGINGMALARAARRIRPEMRILLSSGYWDYIVTEPEPGEQLLHKPYLPKQLIERVLCSLEIAEGQASS